jgi:hypothetical protein
MSTMILLLSLSLALAVVSFVMMSYIRDLRARVNMIELEVNQLREYVDVFRSEVNEGNRSVKELREKVMLLIRNERG